jgi:GNAT superfamily N-acetyltransferase
MVTLTPMLADEWSAWRERSIRDYAADKVRIGSWPAAEAVTLAEDDFARLLPDGQATPGHEFRSIRNGAGDAVGALWFGRNDGLDASTAFIWDIGIDLEHRGHGYGRAALLGLEPIAREGRVVPLSLRTNWSADARTSSSVAGGSKFASVLMFLHMIAFSYRAAIRCAARSP